MLNEDLKSEYRVVGTRPDRPDGLDKVTGRARYGADLSLPGMLWGAVLRSPHAHARIKGIDASQALALEGVKAVVTRADLATGLADEDWNFWKTRWRETSPCMTAMRLLPLPRPRRCWRRMLPG